MTNRTQRGLACGAAARVGEQRILSMREAVCMKVVNAAGGGHGLHAEYGPLTDDAGFLHGVGAPQLKAAVAGEPVNLAQFQGIVLGASHK